MTIHFNMDPKVIRVGGRKAPAMTIEQLQQLIAAACTQEARDENGDINDVKDSVEYTLAQAFESDPSEKHPFQKAVSDWKVECSRENILMLEFKMGNNGVPFGWMLCGGDCEIPVYGMLYWDGKAFRIYIPTYGNPFDAKNKTTLLPDIIDLGSLPSANNLGPFPCTKDGVFVCLSFNSDEEFEEIMPYIEVNEEACKEDFNRRVVSTGQATDTEFESWLKKVSKAAKRYDECY